MLLNVHKLSCKKRDLFYSHCKANKRLTLICPFLEFQVRNSSLQVCRQEASAVNERLSPTGPVTSRALCTCCWHGFALSPNHHPFWRIGELTHADACCHGVSCKTMPTCRCAPRDMWIVGCIHFEAIIHLFVHAVWLMHISRPPRHHCTILHPWLLFGSGWGNCELINFYPVVHSLRRQAFLCMNMNSHLSEL